MKLARILSTATQELNGGNLKVRVNFDAIPEPQQVAMEASPKDGIVFKKLIENGYFGKNGDQLKTYELSVIVGSEDNGRTGYAEYTTEDIESIKTSNSPEALGIVPNASQLDPGSN